jgi:hypothetical protein
MARITHKRAIAALKRSLKVIGDERDKLRDLVNDIESLENVCDDAIPSLEQAIDSLSGEV